MILQDLKKYLMQSRTSTLFELTTHFKTDPEVIRSMLQYWIRKEKVRQNKPYLACQEICKQCDPLQTELYEWID